MVRTITLRWTLSLAILAAGAWLVCPQGQCTTTAIDHVGLNLAHDLRGARLDRWMPALTWLGSLAVLLPVTALAALALCRGRNRRAAGFLMLALLGASALSHLVKLAVMRPRPDLLPVWTAMPTDWSYPSAHAMQITALAVAVVFVVARRRALWILPLGSRPVAHLPASPFPQRRAGRYSGRRLVGERIACLDIWPFVRI